MLVGLEERTGTVRQIPESEEHFVLVIVTVAFNMEIAVSGMKKGNESLLHSMFAYIVTCKTSITKYLC